MQMIRDGLNLTVVPEVHRRTLVWIHGFGDTAELFADDFFHYPIIPDCKVVLPTADEVPVPCRNGELHRAWYTNLGSSVPDSSLEGSVHRINEILSRERNLTDCLLIGGFSQGAAMSLMCGLSRFEGRVDGILALSGFAFDHPIRPDRKDIPILAYHGSHDDIIPVNRAASSYERNLEGANLQLEIEPNLKHEVTGLEYDFIRKWFRTKFSLPSL